VSLAPRWWPEGFWRVVIINRRCLGRRKDWTAFVPKTKEPSVGVGISLPASLFDALRDCAEENNSSVQDEIRRLVRGGLAAKAAA
jgi:hypothetical protein